MITEVDFEQYCKDIEDFVRIAKSPENSDSYKVESKEFRELDMSDDDNSPFEQRFTVKKKHSFGKENEGVWGVLYIKETVTVDPKWEIISIRPVGNDTDVYEQTVRHGGKYENTLVEYFIYGNGVNSTDGKKYCLWTERVDFV